MPKPKVLITVPNRGWLRRELFQILFDMCADPRIIPGVHLPAMVPLENAQHHIIKKILDEDWDYWLSLDDDTIPYKNPMDLVFLDKDIIGCPYPIFTKTNTEGLNHLHWAAYRYDPATDAHEEWGIKEGLQKVDAVGGGAFVIARRVLQDPRMQTGAFTRETREDGTVKRGNDLSFCHRARNAGWEIWCHYDYPCAHVKEMDLAEIIRWCNLIARNPNAIYRNSKSSAEASAPEAEPVLAEASG